MAIRLDIFLQISHVKKLIVPRLPQNQKRIHERAYIFRVFVCNASPFV